MADIHPTAIVESGASIGADAVIGPYCLVGADVELAPGVQMLSHAVVAGRTKVGEGTRIFPFASIGHPPQDLKYKGEASTLVIGRHNVIREHVTMNPGTEGGGMVTKVGDNCLFMVGCHVAHDCLIGDHVIMANNATLGGHVQIGDHAILGGLCAVHQFVRIGPYAMIGGMSGVEQDVIPYGSVLGDRAKLSGLNIIGMKRHGISRENIHALRTAYRLLFAQEGALNERLDDAIEMFADNTPVMEIVNFMRAESVRGVCQPKAGNAA